MMQLAAYLGLDKSSVTGLVDRAERRGLVRRLETPEDGRATRVAITQRHIDLLVAELTAAERKILRSLATKLVSRATT